MKLNEAIFRHLLSTLSFAFFILLLVPLPWSDCIAKSTVFLGGLSREHWKELMIVYAPELFEILKLVLWLFTT